MEGEERITALGLCYMTTHPFQPGCLIARDPVESVSLSEVCVDEVRRARGMLLLRCARQKGCYDVWGKGSDSPPETGA